MPGGQGPESEPLAGVVKGGLMGSLAPKVVLAPDGRSIAYSTWKDLVELDSQKSFSDQGIQTGDALGLPSIHILTDGIHRIPGERDLEIPGAYSFAWRDDGAIAYLQGRVPEYRANVVYEGDIMVAPALWDEPAVWSTYPAQYVVYGWAQDHLIAYEMQEGGYLKVLALDGVGQVRVLVDNATIMAVNPDGTQVMVSDQDLPVVRVIDVSSGEEIQSLDLSGALTAADDAPVPPGGPGSSRTSGSLVTVGGTGSWQGDVVAVPGGPGILTFRVAPRSISLDSTVTLPLADFPFGVREALQLAGGEVLAWGALPVMETGETPYAVVECIPATSQCTRSKTIHARGTGISMAYNPSRP
jgi:hypothetical protein